MLEKITVSDIMIDLEAKNWQDAIRQSSRLLLERGNIEESYISAMINSVYENGPYIVITNHIALAHARPEYGVNYPGITFSTLKTPINFGIQRFDPVKLIITLAAKHPDDHLEILSEIAVMLSDNQIVQSLINASTPDEFVKIISDNM